MLPDVRANLSLRAAVALWNRCLVADSQGAVLCDLGQWKSWSNLSPKGDGYGQKPRFSSIQLRC